MAARSCRSLLRGFGMWGLVLLLVGCATGPAPVVRKIGLVAPFEGRYREVGSDVIPAVRLAIREWTAAHSGVGVAFELVAYDDMGDPDLAYEQAQKLIADPDVVIVIGHWRDVTTSAALPVYASAGLPLVTYSTDDLGDPAGLWNLSPSQPQLADAVEQWATEADIPVVPLMNSQPTIQLDIDQLVAARSGSYATNTVIVGGPAWDNRQFPLMAPERERDNILFVSGLAVPDESVDVAVGDSDGFSEAYREGNLGMDPGPYAVTAYRAAQLALGIASARVGIGDFDAASLSLTFNEDGRRLDAPIYLYQWRAGARQLQAVLVP